MLFKVSHCAGRVSANTGSHQEHWGDREMGALISCTKCSQEAGLIHKVGRSSLKVSPLCELSFMQLSGCIHTVNLQLRDTYLILNGTLNKFQFLKLRWKSFDCSTGSLGFQFQILSGSCETKSGTESLGSRLLNRSLATHKLGCFMMSFSPQDVCTLNLWTVPKVLICTFTIQCVPLAWFPGPFEWVWEWGYVPP